MRGSFSSTLLALAFGAACAGEPATKRDAEFKVALLTPGPIAYQAWNGEAYRGLIVIRDSIGAVISHIETRTPAVRFLGNEGLRHRVSAIAERQMGSLWKDMTAEHRRSAVSWTTRRL